MKFRICTPISIRQFISNKVQVLLMRGVKKWSTLKVAQILSVATFEMHLLWAWLCGVRNQNRKHRPIRRAAAVAAAAAATSADKRSTRRGRRRLGRRFAAECLTPARPRRRQRRWGRGTRPPDTATSPHDPRPPLILCTIQFGTVTGWLGWFLPLSIWADLKERKCDCESRSYIKELFDGGANKKYSVKKQYQILFWIINIIMVIWALLLDY